MSKLYSKYLNFRLASFELSRVKLNLAQGIDINPNPLTVEGLVQAYDTLKAVENFRIEHNEHECTEDCKPIIMPLLPEPFQVYDEQASFTKKQYNKLLNWSKKKNRKQERQNKKNGRHKS